LGHHARMRLLGPVPTSTVRTRGVREPAGPVAPWGSLRPSPRRIRGPYSKQQPQYKEQLKDLSAGTSSLPGDSDFLDAVLAIVVLDVAVLLAKFVDPACDFDVLLTVFQDFLDAPLTPPAYSLQAIGALADL